VNKQATLAALPDWILLQRLESAPYPCEHVRGTGAVFCDGCLYEIADEIRSSDVAPNLTGWPQWQEAVTRLRRFVDRPFRDDGPVT
jgi:hypothetical protein